MAKVKVVFEVSREILEKLDALVSKNMFPSRSSAIQQALTEKLARLHGNRLAIECAKLDRNFEKAFAEDWSRPEEDKAREHSQ